MLRKLLILVIVLNFVVIISSGKVSNDYDYEEKNANNEILSTITPTITPTEKTTQSSPKICVYLNPNFVSTRKGGYQTLECSAKICDGDGDDSDEMDTNLRFFQPIFDWNSQSEHVYASNGTCDMERLHCWHSIDIDLDFMGRQMVTNGLSYMKVSCSVSDYLTGVTQGEDGWVANTDYTFMKGFKGRGIDQSCDNDLQCGENMICVNSGRNGGPSCQCSVDYLTGVQYVQVMDTKFEEWLCMPPISINDTCLYDKQCQAMDTNTECAEKHTDTFDYGLGVCKCVNDMVLIGTGCQPKTNDITPKPTIIWWIFTSDESDNSSSMHRFWWLRTASYLMAVIAILLPLTLIFISMAILCYKRLARKASVVQTVVRPKFPSSAAPKIIISDFMSKDKMEDKLDLVKNDHLIA